MTKEEAREMLQSFISDAPFGFQLPIYDENYNFCSKEPKLHKFADEDDPIIFTQYSFRYLIKKAYGLKDIKKRKHDKRRKENKGH